MPSLLPATTGPLRILVLAANASTQWSGTALALQGFCKQILEHGSSTQLTRLGNRPAAHHLLMAAGVGLDAVCGLSPEAAEPPSRPSYRTRLMIGTRIHEYVKYGVRLPGLQAS